MKKVAIIMGSDSDLPVVAPAIKQLKELEIEVEARVMMHTEHQKKLTSSQKMQLKTDLA